MRSRSFLMLFVVLLLTVAVLPSRADQVIDIFPGHRHRTASKVRGDVTVEKGETIKEASAVQGDITVYGHVTGDASAVMGNVEIKPGGRVDGDATAVMGDVRIRSGATVGGDATAIMGAVVKDHDAKIGGSKTTVGPSVPKWTNWWIGGIADTSHLAFFAIFAAVALLGQVLATALLVALFPQRIASIAECSVTRPGWSVLYGIAGLLAAVPVALLLLITCVGIPFIAVEAILLYAMWIVGAVGVKLAIGQKLGEGVHRPFDSAIWAAVVGTVLLWAVWLVPFAGDLIVSALSVIGFGAVIITGFGTHPDWFSRRFSKGQATQTGPTAPADPPQTPE